MKLSFISMKISALPSIVVPAWAFATESVDAVDTLATVGAWVRDTLVDVRLTMLPGESWYTLARISGGESVSYSKASFS
jgi:hypothetical protein